MATGKGERILIVDDDLSILSSVSQYLQLEGFETASAASGKEGLEWMKQHRADIILLDVNMPEMNGFEVLETIRKDNKLQHIPVLLLTGNVSEKDQLQGWHKGAAHYVTKPFEMDELVDAITTILEEKRRQITQEKEYEI